MMPDKENAAKLRELTGYLLGIAMRKSGVELCTASIQANHPHLDLNDPDGELPLFKSTFFGLFGRALNVLRGRYDSVWASGGSCDTQPVDRCGLDCGEPFADSPLADLVYTLTNPVKDGLVPRGERWPGFHTCGWEFGEVRVFKRPDWFFRPETTSMPATVEVKLSRPTGVLVELSDEELSQRLRDECRGRERYFRDKMRDENRRFLGESRISKQDWKRLPSSVPPKFVVKPKFVGGSRSDRSTAVRRHRAWEALYAEAWERWHAGDTQVEFPHGTYWMRRYVGVKVAEAPP